MIVKIHTHKDGRICVTVVDSEHIGKLFSEGPLQLDLASDYYKGEEKTREETGDLMRNADMVELVGEKAIQLGIEEQIIDKQHVKHVQNVPFASAVREESTEQ